MQHLRGPLNPALNFSLGHALDTQTKRHVALHRHGRIKGIGLKHHADIAVSRIGPCHVMSTNFDAPVAHIDQAGNAVQQGGLAATRRPEQHQELALLHIKIEILDDFVCAEANTQFVDADTAHGLALYRPGGDTTHKPAPGNKIDG